ncbi:hypothetical protein SDC9_177259 [bioreactor metagenome]|uniref:Uncharacterized protein n=1 Tax=bioreactor metagenome TaxID=1076179 RepID=A0A645GU79_9ZZZZ
MSAKHHVREFAFPAYGEIYTDRASYRNCDHRDPGRNAAAGFEQGEGDGPDGVLYEQSQTVYRRAEHVCG